MPKNQKHSGTVGYVKKSNSFRVRFNRGGKEVLCKFFNVKWYGSEELARAAAEDFRQLKAAEFAAIKEVSIVESRPKGPEEYKEYIAGFFDGDGSLGMNGSVAVSFCQCQNSGIPGVLEYISKYYGGYYSSYKPKDPAKRIVWQLYIRRDFCSDILCDLNEYSIIKRPQVVQALDYLVTRQNYEEYAAEVKRLKTVYESVEIDAERITLPYLAGFFDAEGCVSVHKGSNHQLWVAFTQHGCLPMLRVIRDLLGFGTGSDSGQLQFSGAYAVRFLEMIRPWSIVKRDQIDVALEFHAHRFNHDPQREALIQKLKQLKKK